MKRLFRWVGISLVSVAGLLLIAYAVVYVLSERVLQHVYTVPVVAISVPTDAAAIAEGQRLVTIRGCLGCHGKQGEGAVLLDDPLLARLIAPNLTTAVPKYSNTELAVIIRNGLRPDGHSMLVMPSSAFVGLTDEDLGRTIAFLRTLPVVSGTRSTTSLGPIGRIGLVAGKFKLEAQRIAETVPPPEATSEEATHGRYLARTICAHCHGSSLLGDSNPEFTSPSLRIVAAYSPEAFAQLMRTGIAIGGRNLTTMTPEAQNHLSQLADTEIADLYAYLHTMPDVVHH